MKPKKKKITEAEVLAAIKKHSTFYVRTELKSGRGFPDCVIGFLGSDTTLVEVKVGRDKLSKSQLDFMSKFPVLIIHAAEKISFIYYIPGGKAGTDWGWMDFAKNISRELGYE